MEIDLKLVSLPASMLVAVVSLIIFAACGGGGEAKSVAIDGRGNLYVVGRTGGSLPGQTNSDFLDAFVVKVSAGP